MSKRSYISRYMLILRRLKTHPYSSYEDLHDYITHQQEYLQLLDDDLEIGFSKRTLQRDLREMRTIFGIDIEYSRSQKGYFISNDLAENMNFQRKLEIFNLFNALNLAEGLAPFLHLENKKSQATEHLQGIIHAIKNKINIEFDYKKFRDNQTYRRTISPYALKEFKNRWYIIAKDCKDNHIKSFAIDRLNNLYITKQKFEYPKGFNIEDLYKNAFGIILPKEEMPQEVILSFNPHQGKYIKTLPLHQSQEILEDNEKELIIKLKIFITHDFFMELLSLGNTVKVIEPQSLASQIKEELKSAYKQYE